MAALDGIKKPLRGQRSKSSTGDREIPSEVSERVRRAVEQIDEHRARDEQCVEFWRGNQYVHVNADAKLIRQDTVTGNIV